MFSRIHGRLIPTTKQLRINRSPPLLSRLPTAPSLSGSEKTFSSLRKISPSYITGTSSLISRVFRSIQDSFFGKPFVPEKIHIDTKEEGAYLRDVAEYGNKYAKLGRLSRNVSKIPIEGISIPSFTGLSHTVAESFLRRRCPEIFSLWKELGTAYAARSSDLAFFSDSKTLSVISDIQYRIVKAFNDLSEEDLLFLGKPELASWLAGIREKKGYIMVRSSGAEEDSKKKSNAGGNLSEAYVVPDLQTVLSSSGRVIASYVGPLSLKNRAERRDNPFSSPLFFPVLSNGHKKTRPFTAEMNCALSGVIQRAIVDFRCTDE